jgi:hypothetical protein
MAGRAGRRGYVLFSLPLFLFNTFIAHFVHAFFLFRHYYGLLFIRMDTSGTCVIVATPFENESVAAKILTDPIKPIQSQFSPSYSLCVNLIERGQGRLTVARQLISKSFDVWQQRNAMSRRASETGPEVVGLAIDTLNDQSRTLQEARFIELVRQTLNKIVSQRSSMFDIARLESVLKVLKDRSTIIASSKAFLGLERRLVLEKQTLDYLELELDSTQKLNLEADFDDTDAIQQIAQDDMTNMLDLVNVQRSRLLEIENEISRHPFTFISTVVNKLLIESRLEDIQYEMLTTLSLARDNNDSSELQTPLTPSELASFLKSFVIADRMARKAANKRADRDTEHEEEQDLNRPMSQFVDDDSWNDFISITKVLLVYGCLAADITVAPDEKSTVDSSLRIGDNATFTVTPAGSNVGLLGLENSLWVLVALGGASDTIKTPSDVRFDKRLSNDEEGENSSSDSNIPEGPLLHQQQLVEALRTMTPSELAGYVSCIISEDSRSNFGLSVVDEFQRFTLAQQDATQRLLYVMDRFKEIQNLFGVDSKCGSCNMYVFSQIGTFAIIFDLTCPTSSCLSSNK